MEEEYYTMIAQIQARHRAIFEALEGEGRLDALEFIFELDDFGNTKLRFVGNPERTDLVFRTIKRMNSLKVLASNGSDETITVAIRP